MAPYQLSAPSFLDLVGAFGEETEHAIWSVVLGGLGAIEHHALDEDARAAFEEFVRNLLAPAQEKLGWTPKEGESDLERKLRGALIGAMGNLANDGSTVTTAREVVGDVFAGEAVDPEITTAALAVYAKHGGADEYDTLWSTYRDSQTPLDQVRYLRATAGVEEPESAISTLDKIIDGDIRTQDGFWVLARLFGGRSGPLVWENARQRWDDVLDAKWKGMTKPRVVEGIPALSQPEVANDVRGFFSENPIPEAARALTQKLEMLETNVNLRERETGNVSKYFGG